jgi:molybdopterin converting factor small subunit
MKIWLKSIGDLRDYFGREPQEISLDEKATLRDLLLMVDERWGEELPGYLWDPKKKYFRGSIFFIINEEVVQDLQTPLQDKSQVTLFRAMSGG